MHRQKQISLLQNQSDLSSGMQGLKTPDFWGDKVPFDWETSPENHPCTAPSHAARGAPLQQSSQDTFLTEKGKEFLKKKSSQYP